MLLLVEKQDGIAVVTLNRPEAMNALSKAMRSALYKAMKSRWTPIRRSAW
jgi:enoyl-CoA hydratase